MATKAPEVPCFFPPPNREISLKAISLCLLRIHANHEGITWKEIARVLDCSVETVTAARDEENLLSFDTSQRLAFFFPDEYARYVEPISRRHAPTDAPSLKDRINAVRAALDAIEREAGA